MSSFAEFLELLLTTGEARLSELPEADDTTDAQNVLTRAFDEYRLEIAGPLIPFDPNAALAAALFTARACWFAVSREEPPEVVAEALKPLAKPTTAAAHLSIDLTLRLTTTIQRRAQAHDAQDVLATRLADVLGSCPLTGALASLATPPTGDMTLAGHTGLALCFAERLAANYRPAWLPGSGPVREAVELVYQEMGQEWPPKL